MKYGGTARRAIRTSYHPYKHHQTSAEVSSATEAGVGTVLRLPHSRSRVSSGSWMERRSRASSSRRGWRSSQKSSDRCARGVSSSCARLGSTPFRGIASPLQARTLRCVHLRRERRRWIPVSGGYDSASAWTLCLLCLPRFSFFIKLLWTIGPHPRIIVIPLTYWFGVPCMFTLVLVTVGSECLTLEYPWLSRTIEYD